MSFELAWPHRSHRVRFKRAIRVVPLVEGPPRAFRVLSGNLSKQGMFLSMPEPFNEGTRVALSLEAGGRVLPFAQAEVVWRNLSDAVHSAEPKGPGATGFGVKFTSFLHPRAHDLVSYLVDNLDTGRPLALPKPKRWKRVAMWTGAVMASAVLASFGVFLAKQMTSADPVDENAAVAEAAPVPDPVIAAPTAAPVPAPTNMILPEPMAAPTRPEPVAAAAAAAPAPERVVLPAERMVIHEPKIPEATAAMAVPEAAKPEDTASTGLLPLPKSGASSLRWSQRNGKIDLEVTPSQGSKFSAAFRLKNPERLVIDLTGTVPKRSFTVGKPEIPGVSGLRIGKRKGIGTRLVLDLKRPAELKVDGSRLQLAY